MFKRHETKALLKAARSRAEGAKLAHVSVRSVQRVAKEGDIERVDDLLEKKSDLESVEVLRRMRLAGYTGRKTALFALIAAVKRATRSLALAASLVSCWTLPAAGSVPAECEGDSLAISFRDRSSGEPIARAAISLGASPESAPLAESNEKGIACVPGAGGETVLFVTHPNYLPAQATLATATRAGRVLLTPIASVALFVRDGASPAPEADLSWSVESGANGQGKTDASGRWKATVGGAGDRFRVLVVSNGYAPACRAVDELVAGTTTLEVELRRPGALVLSPRDENGNPLKDVALEWTPETGPGPCAKEPALSGTSRGREDTTWIVEGLAPGRGVLTVSAPGYGAKILPPAEIRTGQATDLGTVRMMPRRSLSGVVVSRAGKGLPDVPVQVLSSAGGEREGEAVTDSAGRFDVEVRRNAGYVIRAGSPPGPLAETDARSDGEEAVEIVLPDAAALVGSVESAGQDPVEGARMIVAPLGERRESDPRFSRECRTDARGRFKIPDLAAGRWKLRVRAPGFAPKTIAPIDLAEGETERMTVRLEEGLTIRGRVLDSETRETVSGARVFLESGDEDSWSTTDARGAFELGGIPRGVTKVGATHADFGRGRVVVDPAEGPIEIVLAADGAVEGAVSDGTGSPLSASVVEVERLGLRTETDSLGRYRIEGVPAGRHRVVHRRGLPGEERRLAAREVEIAPGETVEVNFQEGISVAGVVRWNDEPIGEALVTFARMNEGRPSGNVTDTLATTRTDDGGRYRIDGLRPGPYTAGARKSGFAFYRSVDLREDGENRVDLLLSGTTIEGRARNSVTGADVSSARVVACDPHRSYLVNGAWLSGEDVPVDASQVLDTAYVASSGRDGRFSLVLPPGPFRIEVNASGYERQSRDIEVTEGRIDSYEFLLAPAGNLSGRIVDGFGNAVGGAAVTALCGTELLFQHTISDPSGIFRFEGLRLDGCTLLAYLPGHGAGFQQASALAGDAAFTEIAIQAIGSLEIAMTAKSGREALPQIVTSSGARIDHILASTAFFDLKPQLTTREDGSLSIRYPGLPAGTYLLVLPDSTEVRPAQVNQGAETFLDLSEGE